MTSTNAPSMHECLFLGGPMHGKWASVNDASEELVFRFERDRTWSGNLRDRYTRRRLSRIAPDQSCEISALFAHETWLDEEISASHVPDKAFVPADEFHR